MNKPKLLFFQFRYEGSAPEFMLMHKREHVKCLEHFFDVTVVNKDCDYEEICDRHEPDLALFETGLQLPAARHLAIRNTHRCPAVPKAGFLNADAWAETRAGIISDMDQWGIKTFFSICATAAEHTPELARNLLVWPNFIDPDVIHDYRESKIVPVLLSGCQDPQYPWRHKVYKLIAKHYPSIICPHGGYRKRPAAGQVLQGEQYARAINASFFSATCGTTAKELLRKHLEIPGCRTCLLTEEAPVLKAAGFVDMENCVFVDERTVIDKLSWLFERPDVLEKITDAGHRLVQERHTMRNRDQIFQWLNLKRNLGPDQTIVQKNPFEPLALVRKSAPESAAYLVSNGLHLELFRRADELLWAGKYAEAERLYHKSSNYMGGLMAEPLFRLVLCDLYQGRPQEALLRITEPLYITLERYGASDPDPVEWAYFILTLLCLGRTRDAEQRAGQFPRLHHPELDRSRMVVQMLLKSGNTGLSPLPEDQKARPSIHQLPCRTLEDWLEQLFSMLNACGRSDLAAKLKKASASAATASHQDGGRHREPETVHASRPTNNLGLDYCTPGSRVKRFVADAAHRLERRFGYFLPYRISEKRHDEFFSALRILARDEKIAAALMIGAREGRTGAEAFLSGILENENRPSAFCIGIGSRVWTKEKNSGFADKVGLYTVPASGAEDDIKKFLAKQIRQMKNENRIQIFDVVYIDAAGLPERPILYGSVSAELHQAKHVILNGLNKACCFEGFHSLLGNSRYTLSAYNLDLRDGYAIFRREAPAEDVSSVKDQCLAFPHGGASGIPSTEEN